MKSRDAKASAFSAAILVMSIVSAPAETVIEQATHNTRAGASAEIGHHARWDLGCEPLTAPKLTIERPPTHGSVCLSEGPVTPVTSRSGVARNCVGKTVLGLRVVYRPNAAFTGVDTLRYALDAPEGHVSRDVSITIEGFGKNPASALILPADEMQASGPMPPCQQPIS